MNVHSNNLTSRFISVAFVNCISLWNKFQHLLQNTNNNDLLLCYTMNMSKWLLTIYIVLQY